MPVFVYVDYMSLGVGYGCPRSPTHLLFISDDFAAAFLYLTIVLLEGFHFDANLKIAASRLSFRIPVLLDEYVTAVAPFN